MVFGIVVFAIFIAIAVVLALLGILEKWFWLIAVLAVVYIVYRRKHPKKKKPKDPRYDNSYYELK